MSVSKKLLLAAAALASITVVGVIGYMLIEGWSFMDALYMTVISITTTGFLEVHEMDTAGRVFTILLIIGGSSSALYALTIIVLYIMEGHLGSALWRRSMKNRIAHLKNHFILCGYGRVGQEIARILADEKADFVIIDKSREGITQAEMDNHLYIMADAASDDTLKEAGIERARGLIVAIGNDADSTYVTLSARQIKPDLFIEARISSHEAEGKLKRAGADRIVSPYSIGARRMAMLALQPEVADFIDIVSFKGHDMYLENLIVGKGSMLAEKTLGDARKESKAVVLAINRNNRKMITNPSDNEKIQAGDSLIAMGTREELRALEGICESCNLEK
jgi:voltage-gated potassium channel